MSVEIKNLVSGNTLAINADGEAAVGLTQTKLDAGFACIAGEIHDGSNGVARLVRRVSLTNNQNMRTSQNNILWRDVFNHAIVQNDAYQVSLTTFTTAVTGGFWTLNSGSSVAASAVARVQTYRTFEVFGGGMTTTIAVKAKLGINPTSNTGGEIGLGYATAIATPNDGVYFKIPATGNFVGVMNFNGTETTVDLVTSPVANTVYDLRISINSDGASFFVNDVLEGRLSTPSTAAAGFMSRSMPVLCRLFNTASGASSAQQLSIGEMIVFQEDATRNLSASELAVSNCFHSVNVPRGTATGQTLNYANTAAPASATLSNTAAGYTTLGGQWQFAAVAGAETDYALFGYQVPASSVTGGNKNLWITGINIDTFNMGAAVATTPTLLQWSLGFGSTAVSLATADGTGTRAPRRLPLGVQCLPVATPVGGCANAGINVRFKTPIMVDAGTFLHIILKMPTATATASQIVRGIVGVEGYFE